MADIFVYNLLNEFLRFAQIFSFFDRSNCFAFIKDTVKDATYRGGGHDSYREMKARTYRRKVSGCVYEMGRYVPSSPATATTCTYSKKCLIEYS